MIQRRHNSCGFDPEWAVVLLAALAGSCATKPVSSGATGTTAPMTTKADAPAPNQPASTGNQHAYTPITAAGAAAMERTPGAPGTPREFNNRTHVRARTSEAGVSTDVPEGLTQVTFGSDGADFDPSVSRDGKVLIFSSTQHRPTADLYMTRVGSRAVTQLTADPANDVMPALSPDGKFIAFASDRTGSWQVYLMPASGGRAVALTDGAGGDALHPTWSPDGQRIAFSRLGQMSGRWELWTLSIASPASAEFLGFGMFPEWCPVPGTGDNQADRIAFQRGRERGDRGFGVWTIDYKPGSVGNPVQIVALNTDERAAAINPSWSPDGQYIAYAQIDLPEATPAPVAPVVMGLSSNPNSATVVSGQSAGAPAPLPALTPPPAPRVPGSRVWVAAADGSARVNLTTGATSDLSPSWSRDGRVFFVSRRNGREQVWALSSERAVAALPGNKLNTGLATGPAQDAPADSANSTDPAMTTVPTP
jgi:TolB protein